MTSPHYSLQAIAGLAAAMAIAGCDQHAATTAQIPDAVASQPVDRTNSSGTSGDLHGPASKDRGAVAAASSASASVSASQESGTGAMGSGLRR